MSDNQDYDKVELQEWLEAIDSVVHISGPERAKDLIRALRDHTWEKGGHIRFSPTTPYVNTIHHELQPRYPGNRDMEKRLKNIIRWNAMAMVVRANKTGDALGGHISTFASSASLYEVGFNHFFRARTETYGGDMIYFQGHSSPGIYARAFVEGRLDESHLSNFRRELAPGGGLSSYPHPRLMPEFWQFPTVSMGLGPLMAAHQARYSRYLECRGLKPKNGGKIWAFLGDGEMDEPETVAALTMASREKLDNLVFVVNCNLQSLDGPVRGNGKIIQEVESTFRGGGWKVIKVLWGSEWDALFDRDKHGALRETMMETLDGEYQKFSVETGAYAREHFFGKHPDLAKLVENMTDEEIMKLRRGGHDPVKLFAAYQKAVNTEGMPTVILAHTVKGYGVGPQGEGKNVAHNQKKLNEDELRMFRDRFHVPIADEQLKEVPFYRPKEDSEEMKYLLERREKLGGFLPERHDESPSLKTPDESVFEEFYKGSGGRNASTTMVYGRILSKLLKDKEIGKYIVPIIPDEARTFGMEGLFRQVGIFSQTGQLYEPVDRSSLQYYREEVNGQIIEEGINEAGAMATFLAAGTAYANHGVPSIPFYTYYSMFGFQRVGDLVWAGGDLLAKGFLIGGTAGRTSLNGEGLQHQDGHSHIHFGTVPNCLTYDPAYGFELAVIIREGLRRMYENDEKIFYYLTVTTDDTAEMLPMPEKDRDAVKDGILKGMYRFKKSTKRKGSQKAHILGSGPMMPYALKAAERLKEYKVDADVWSVTSYTELRRDALECDRYNLFHPDEPKKVPFVTKAFEGEEGVLVSTSDYMKLLADHVSKWLPLPHVSLGTDGYGLSETRAALRDHFEIDDRYVVLATLSALHEQGKVKVEMVKQAIKDLEINVEKRDPNPSQQEG